MNRFLRNGRGLLLAYDQGFEHGPADFDAKNVDPAYILDIAKRSGVFTGVILQKGIAERYYTDNRQQTTENSKLPPLIIKLNGKTAFHQGEEPFAPLLCTVDEAIQLGASAVGYTVYVGSEYEAKMTRTLGDIVRDCNHRRIPTIAWMSLRGKHIKDPHDRQKLAYAARLGLELGADAVKLQFTLGGDQDRDIKDLRWIVQNAGKCKVFISGGPKIPNDRVFQLTKVVKTAGAAGLAIGHNIWQRQNPVEFAKQIADILWRNYD
jgi:class I fructose-bisphosphate aldolase